MTDFAMHSILVVPDLTPEGELAKSTAGLVSAARRHDPLKTTFHSECHRAITQEMAVYSQSSNGGLLVRPAEVRRGGSVGTSGGCGLRSAPE